MANTEQAVRDAAQKLLDTIFAARDDGLHVQWPSRPEDLAFIAISETGKGKPVVTIAAAAGTDAEVIERAGAAAQKAVDKVVEPPAGKK